MLSPLWDPYARDPTELASLEALVVERRREAEHYRRRRAAKERPPAKKGPGRPPKSKIPPHLQVGREGAG